MESGKSAMLNALVGLGIALSARVIASLIEQALGSGAGGPAAGRPQRTRRDTSRMR